MILIRFLHQQKSTSVIKDLNTETDFRLDHQWSSHFAVGQKLKQSKVEWSWYRALWSAVLPPVLGWMFRNAGGRWDSLSLSEAVFNYRQKTRDLAVYSFMMLEQASNDLLVLNKSRNLEHDKLNFQLSIQKQMTTDHISKHFVASMLTWKVT